jgi:hypothetical protein
MRWTWPNSCTRRTRRCTTASAASAPTCMSLVRADGAMDLYDGVLRAARCRRARSLFDGVRPDYLEPDRGRSAFLELHEVPHLRSLGGAGLVQGRPAGAGAELRLHSHPRAEPSARPLWPGAGANWCMPAGLPLGAHDRDAARAEVMPTAGRPDLLSGDLSAGRAPAQWRGHHRGAARHPDPPLRVGDDDLVTMCNLIVSTTHNNQAMNEAVRSVARATWMAASSPKACSTTSRWPSAPTTPACPAPPMRWARCRWTGWGTAGHRARRSGGTPAAAGPAAPARPRRAGPPHP